MRFRATEDKIMFSRLMGEFGVKKKTEQSTKGLCDCWNVTKSEREVSGCHLDAFLV